MKLIIKIKQILLIKKLRKLCFHPVYFSGCEIYRLLNYNTLPTLIINIKKGNIKLDSRVLFGRTKISSQEQFIYILSKYIVFVRDNFHIHTTELIAILEETLKSKYSNILYSHLDFNSGNNCDYFYREFKRMFLENIYNNFQYLTHDDANDKLLLNLKLLSLDNDNDLDKIFKIFQNIINKRENNIYHCFVKLNNNFNNNYEQSFYKVKCETILEDYHNKIINF